MLLQLYFTSELIVSHFIYCIPLNQGSVTYGSTALWGSLANIKFNIFVNVDLRLTAYEAHFSAVLCQSVGRCEKMAGLYAFGELSIF